MGRLYNLPVLPAWDEARHQKLLLRKTKSQPFIQIQKNGNRNALFIARITEQDQSFLPKARPKRALGLSSNSRRHEYRVVRIRFMGFRGGEGAFMFTHAH